MHTHTVSYIHTMTGIFIDVMLGVTPRLSNAIAVNTGDTLLWSPFKL